MANRPGSIGTRTSVTACRMLTVRSDNWGGAFDDADAVGVLHGSEGHAQASFPAELVGEQHRAIGQPFVGRQDVEPVDAGRPDRVDGAGVVQQDVGEGRLLGDLAVLQDQGGIVPSPKDRRSHLGT